MNPPGSHGTPSEILAAEERLIAGLSKQDGRTLIDSRVAYLKQSLLALNGIRNTLAPIYVLPDEILAEIFWVLSQGPASPGPTLGPDFEWGGRLWRNVCSVCRQWRVVAFNTPRLWACINGANIRLTEEFIQRSKNAPISLTMKTASRTFPAHTLVELIKPHFDRVQSVRFGAPAGIMAAFVERLKLPAPGLKVLCLYQNNAGRVIAPLNDQLILPPVLFRGRTPALGHIHLDHVTMNISAATSQLSGLVHLELHNQSTIVAPSMRTFLDFLETCPRLKTLALTRAGPVLPHHITEHPPPDRILELPTLRSLTLDNRPVDIANVLANIGISSSCSIVLSCGLEDANADFLALLPRGCSTLRCLTEIASLQLDLEDMAFISVRGRTPASPPPSLSLDMHLSLEEEGILKPRLFLGQLGSSLLPLSHLTELEVVNFASHISKDNWRGVLSRLPHLRSLSAFEPDCELVQQRQLVQALQLPPLTPEGSKSVVCPNLKVMRFTGLDQTDAVIGSIVECCRLRASKGAPLETMIIAHLEYLDEIRLWSIVPNVFGGGSVMVKRHSSFADQGF